MSNEGIRFFLPYFLIFFIIVIFFWGNILNSKSRNYSIDLNDYFKKKIIFINRCSLVFKTILIFYSLIIVVFIYFPDFYNHYFSPIEKFNTTNINGIGFHLLKITFIWFITVQVYKDRLIHNKRLDYNKKQSLFIKAHGLLLVGLFLLFIFYTLIATDYFTLTLLFVSAIIFIVQKIIVLTIPNNFDH